MSDFVLSATLELRDRLTSRIRNAVRGLRSVESSAGSASNSIDRVGRSLNSVRGDRRVTISARDMATPAVSRVNSGLSSLNGRTVSPTIRLRDEASSRVSHIRQELNTLASRAYTATVNIRQNGSAAIGNMASRASSAVSNMMMGAGVQMMGMAGLGYGLVDTIKTYKDFEYQMASVRAVTGANEEEFKRLTKRAKELGETTMFKASDVAAAEGYMGYAGWKTPQIEAGLPHMLNLAAAAGEDLKSISDIVTDAMTGFGIAATDEVKVWTKSGEQMVNATQHFSDIMAALATSSNTTVGMAGESAKYAGAVVGALYSSQSAQDKMNAFADWAVIEGVMADAGIKGSMAGTAQRSMFTRLASLQQNAKAAREALGVDFVYQESGYDQKGLYHEKGQTRALRDIVGDIRSRFSAGMSAEDILNAAETIEGKKVSKQNRVKIGAMIEEMQANGGKMSDATKASMTTLLGGQEGLAAWLAVFTASDESWKKKLEAVDKAHNKALEMKEIKEDTLEGDLQSISAAWEGLQLEIMTGKGGKGLRGFLQAAAEDIRAFKKSLEDGFDIGDIASLTGRIVKQLTDKFLALDGVGSVLAGGALIGGLYKIGSVAGSVISKLRTLARSPGMGAATSAPSPANLASSVGSMVVNARSVVVNGGAGGFGRRAGVGRGRNTPVNLGQNAAPAVTRNTPVNAPLNLARPATTPAATSAVPPASTSVLKGGGGVLALGGILSALNVYGTKQSVDAKQEEEAEAVKMAQKAVENATAELKKKSADKNTSQEELKELTSAVASLKQEQAAAETHKAEVDRQNTAEMGASIGGAVGTVAGTAIGAVLGGPPGAMIGGVIGDFAGNAIGEKLSYFWQDEEGKERAEQKSVAETREDISAGNYVGDSYDTSAVDQLRLSNDASLGKFKILEAGVAESAQNISTSVEEMSAATTSAFAGMEGELDAVGLEMQTLEMDIGTAGDAFTNLGTIAESGCTVANEGLSSVNETMGTLGPNATTCGAEIAAGINSGVPAVKSEYSGLAGWLNGLISSISSGIDSLIAKGKSLLGIGGGGKIPGHAKGTSYFQGGWTEINEHGGEIIDLPQGSRIYPHATTMEMLKSTFGSMGESFAPPVNDISKSSEGILRSYERTSSPQQQGNTQNAQPSVTITGNTFTVRENADIDRIAHQLFNLLSQSAGNYQYTGG